MRRKSLLLSAALLVSAVGTAGKPHNQNRPAASPNSEHAKHSLAINLLRAINTAEVNYMSKRGFYASKDVLLASDELKGKSWTWAAKNDPQLVNATLSNGPEILPGWTLRLNVAADGKGYDVLLEDTTDKSCGYAAGTDERGIIRQSKSIDCEI